MKIQHASHWLHPLFLNWHKTRLNNSFVSEKGNITALVIVSDCRSGGGIPTIRGNYFWSIRNSYKINYSRNIYHFYLETINPTNGLHINWVMPLAATRYPYLPPWFILSEISESTAVWMSPVPGGVDSTTMVMLSILRRISGRIGSAK